MATTTDSYYHYMTTIVQPVILFVRLGLDERAWEAMWVPGTGLLIELALAVLLLPLLPP